MYLCISCEELNIKGLVYWPGWFLGLGFREYILDEDG